MFPTILILILIFDCRSHIQIFSPIQHSLAQSDFSLQTFTYFSTQQTLQNIYRLHDFYAAFHLHHCSQHTCIFGMLIHQWYQKVIKNYLSSVRSVASYYHLDSNPTSDPVISRFIRSISINSPFSPTPRGIFSIEMLYHISIACEILSDPLLYRDIFLTSYFAFLRMSNIALHSVKKFDPSRHFLRQDVIFAPPGTHLIIKWTKTLQDNKSHHVVQLPQLSNIYLCPVRALSALMASRKLSPSAPLFAVQSFPHQQVIHFP